MSAHNWRTQRHTASASTVPATNSRLGATVQPNFQPPRQEEKDPLEWLDGIVLPDDDRQQITSPERENPSHTTGNGYVDASRGTFEDGQLDYAEVYTQLNSLFAHVDAGSYGRDGVEPPSIGLHFHDASDGGSDASISVDPLGVLSDYFAPGPDEVGHSPNRRPLSGSVLDTGQNEKGEAVYIAKLPIGPVTTQARSEDPVGVAVDWIPRGILYALGLEELNPQLSNYNMTDALFGTGPESIGEQAAQTAAETSYGATGKEPTSIAELAAGVAGETAAEVLSPAARETKAPLQEGIAAADMGSLGVAGVRMPTLPSGPLASPLERPRDLWSLAENRAPTIENAQILSSISSPPVTQAPPKAPITPRTGPGSNSLKATPLPRAPKTPQSGPGSNSLSPKPPPRKKPKTGKKPLNVR